MYKMIKLCKWSGHTVLFFSLLLAAIIFSLTVATEEDVTPEEWVIGAAPGAEVAAAVVAQLARERLGLSARTQLVQPLECLNATLDSHECLRALLFALHRSASSIYRRGAVWSLLGMAADASDVGGQVLRKLYLEDLGALAPPAARACLASPAGSAPTPTSHLDLQQTALVEPYEFDENELRIASELAKDPITGRYYSEDEEWINGTYTPEWCKNERCGTLAAGDAAEARLVADDARRWRWRVRVVALGPHLSLLVKRLAPRPLLLCAWAPTHTELASSLNHHTFRALAMPPCDLENFSGDVDCHYEARRLLKLVETRLAARHPRALQLLDRISFTLNEYRELAESRAANGSAEFAARHWLAAHEDRARNWTVAAAREVRVGVIVPVEGASSLGGLGLAAAARLAERDSAPDLLDLGIKFKVENYDGMCSARRSVKYVTDALSNSEFGNLAALVGPGCTGALQAVAAQAHAFRLPTVAYTSVPRSATDPWLVLAGGDAQLTARAVGALAMALGWRRMAVLVEAPLRPLTDPGLLHTDVLLHRELADVIDDNNYQIIEEWGQEVAARQGRVLLVAAQEARWVRAALCAGHRAGLVPARTAWLLLTEMVPSDLRPAPTDKHGCSHDQLLQMAEGHLSARNQWLFSAETPPSEWSRRWRVACAELAEAAPLALGLPAAPCATPPLHAPLVYDVVATVADALHSLLQKKPAAADDLHDLYVVRSFMNELLKTNRTGLTGLIRLEGTKERAGYIDLIQWQKGKRVLIGKWDSHGLSLRAEALQWATADGSAPDDGRPRCVLQSLADTLHTDCQAAVAVVAGITIVALATLLLVVFVQCKRRYERGLKARLRALGLTTLSTTGDLGRWELPRERVVINRKLGVGAFGTVYGGHALLADGRWSAVAVKTLKTGAPIEDKLDFLSEAEVMKRLDHDNVVRLLGVVTATEPVCSVMEFMLYGDLKNYLLARRHLAGGTGGEGAADEVSPRRLTAFARDAAHGLAYLADLKYVHRDIAARNCLVSATRGLKLADFGMARRVCETDYYRFSRRGPLPVRWMAPESVTLGIFSSPSDVWSFGVLLYEIVTFGALPFQGLANSEVLEVLKRGGTPRLPPDIDPQARASIEKCWRREPRSRPFAADLATMLAEEPRLLKACLDVPFDSLTLESESWSQGARRAADTHDTSGSTVAHDHDTDTTYLSEEPTPPASARHPDSPDAYVETDRFLS